MEPNRLKSAPACRLAHRKRGIRKNLLSLAALALLVVVAPQLVADPLKTTTTLKVDQHGDGTLTVRFKLSAMDWRMWEENYSNHPDLVLRDLKRGSAAWDLESSSFRLEKN